MRRGFTGLSPSANDSSPEGGTVDEATGRRDFAGDNRKVITSHG
jgi:hypothetical protein